LESDLIDRIYECSFVPAHWPSVLGELAAIASARAGFLFLSNSDIHHFASSTEIGRSAIAPLVASGWVARSDRFVRFLAARKFGFFSDSEIYSPEERLSDPFYRDILFPRGLGWATGMSISLPTGDRFSINLERENARGPVEPEIINRLDVFRPHIARSALMAARLQLERARAASDALARVGLPALVFDQSSKVLAANNLIELLVGHIQWRAKDRISLKDVRADQLLHEAMAQIHLNVGAEVRSFPACDVETGTKMIVHVIPIRLSARDIFTRCAAIVVVTPVTMPNAPSSDIVRSLFDLTPAEARVAQLLASGHTVDDIASEGGISPSTVRTHVRGVLQKTGCARQTDVVALLTGISVPFASPT